MEFSSQLIEILLQCPFHEKRTYSLNAAQCEALSTYFSSNLQKFFGILFSIPSPSVTSRPWNSFSRFYDKRFSRLWSSSHWSSSQENKSSSATLNHGHTGVSAILDELKNAPYAIEELYRVIKEAENFLQICSNPKFWWREAIAIAVTTEAHEVHIHDLMWCIAGLKLALQTSRSVGLESRAQFIRLNIAQCYAEMASLSSQGSQWIRKEEDCASLLLVLQQMSEKYKKMSLIKKKLANDREKQKHDTVQFLLQKLEKAELDSTSCSKQPQPSMHICSQELTFPPRPHLLGQGSFASVFEASWLGIKVAVKQFKYPARKEFFEREAAILDELQSPFIVQLFGQSIDKQKNTCYLVMELVKTNLAMLVKERKKPLQLPVVLDFMLQISRAMEYLHSKNIMHRDLKPSNILVEPLSSSEILMQKGYGRVKLCDFGSAKLNLESCDMTSRVGTKGYRAPEVLSLRDGSAVERVGYSFEADVYSFGMTISYCLTGEEPFADIPGNRLIEMLHRGDRPELPAAICPLSLKELIQKCWSGDPSSRPSFASITMTLRQLKLLLMKARTPVQLSEYSELKEFILSTPVISYTELSVATCDFTRRGQNITLDSMYHGVLSDGTNVLVQCIQNVIDSKKFWVKISQMLNLRHRNIARLRAVCTHSSKCWLIYEYTYVQGSLDRWLEGDKLQEALDTTSCYRIAVGAAFGLQYLHAQHTVFLVRSENILLDGQFEPQIFIDFLECEERDNNPNHLQRNEVLHFGKLISKLLGHMINNGLDLDTAPNKSEVSMLKKVESLCRYPKDVRMDEIVEMLESVYETYHEESLLFDPPQLNFSGSFVDYGEMLESQNEIHSDDSLLLDPHLLEFNGRIEVEEVVDRRGAQCFAI